MGGTHPTPLPGGSSAAMFDLPASLGRILAAWFGRSQRVREKRVQLSWVVGWRNGCLYGDRFHIYRLHTALQVF